EVNLQTNLVRLSFELGSDWAVFEPNNESLFLFAGGTPLLGQVGANVNGTFRFRCEGEGVVTAVPLQTNGATVGWVAALTAPKLALELPAGGSRTVENVSLDGFLAPSLSALAQSVEALSYIGETEKDQFFETHFSMQKTLFRNYPD